VLVEKVKSLENAYSVKHAYLLNSHKRFGDKCGLGFNVAASSSKTLHVSPPIEGEW
jgi:hypothetical protein